jgi:hypothetical protein
MIPIYRSDGEWTAAYLEGHLFTRDGEWIGFLVGREVFDAEGRYLGFLSDDQRLLRQRTVRKAPVSRTPPPQPPRPTLPSTAPLAPLLRALPYQIVDVFEEQADRFKYVADSKPDME